MDTLYAFFISLLFGLIFQVPRKSLVAGGFVGAFGWWSYSTLTLWQAPLLATLLAAIFVGIWGEIFARIYKMPVTIFVIVGFIPLVPGVKAYNTILLLTNGEYNQGMELGLQTIATACAIGLGLSIVSSLARVFKESLRKKI